jgi:hypothetical protein
LGGRKTPKTWTECTAELARLDDLPPIFLVTSSPLIYEDIDVRPDSLGVWCQNMDDDMGRMRREEGEENINPTPHFPFNLEGD